ncbi:MAG: SpoIIIAH-like family protein [Clostridia bacterium]|nr:SpoIIIAH-like family protein [Clostridia bacterium]MDD4375860.1 SpoIIIAH-like family protein [Clostridia bacterium]
MKVLKRSQIAVISLSLMVMIAGYINYKYNPEREENLGQTLFVNSKDGFMYSNVNIYDEENKKYDNKKMETANLYDEKNKKSLNNFRASRNNMFSELQANYSSVISANATNDEQIKEYQDKLNELIKNKHLITIVEDIIKSKGIDDIVIVPTNENLNVIVADKEEITKDKIAMIQKIIQDELKFPANKITISVP